MSLVLLSTSKALDLYQDTENDWLYLDWQGDLELASVQDDCRNVLTWVRETGVQKALNDNSRLTKISWELVKWVSEEYLPAAGQLGVQYVAWVHSAVLDCRPDIDLLVPVADNRPPQVALFDDLATAYAWLRSVNVPVAPAPKQPGLPLPR
jgi:hypothetical protein